MAVRHCKRHTQNITKLLKLKPDPNAANGDGQTALHLAAENTASGELTGVLVAAGADVNVADKAGRMPLHLAVAARNGNAVVALLRAGAKAGFRDKRGRTPLFYAVPDKAVYNYNHDAPPEIVSRLLRAKADPKATDDVGFTPLHLAAQARAVEFARTLVENGADVDARTRDGRTPLMMVTCLGSGDEPRRVSSVLIAKGARADVVDDRGRGVLHHAVKCRWFDSKSVRHLVKKGARLNLVDKNGDRPIHVACRAGNQGLIKQLRWCKADFGIADKSGLFPLHLAVQSGEHRAVREVLEAKVQIDAIDPKGNTALHLAARLKDLTIASVLIRHKAAANVKNKAGKTPLDLGGFRTVEELETKYREQVKARGERERREDFRGW